MSILNIVKFIVCSNLVMALCLMVTFNVSPEWPWPRRHRVEEDI